MLQTTIPFQCVINYGSRIHTSNICPCHWPIWIWYIIQVQNCLHTLIAGLSMMASSNGNIFRVTGHLCGNSPVPGEFPAQRPVTRSFDVFFDLRLNQRLSKQCEAGDFRCYLVHFDVIVMIDIKPFHVGSIWTKIKQLYCDMTHVFEILQEGMQA